MTESLVLGKVREQFADLEQSSLRNDNFLGAHSHLRSECLKRTHRLRGIVTFNFSPRNLTQVTSAMEPGQCMI